MQFKPFASKSALVRYFTVILTVLTVVLVVCTASLFVTHATAPVSEVGPEYLTRSQLRLISLLTIQYYMEYATEEERQRIAELRSAEELFLLLNAQLDGHGKPIAGVDVRASFERDAWQRPLNLKVEAAGKLWRFRIISCGPNGIFEDGYGDDMFFEMTLARDRVARAVLGPPVVEVLTKGAQ